MPKDNLQANLKDTWIERDIVMPEDVNEWSSNINNLNEVIPVYSANGNFYKIKSVADNVINLGPVIMGPAQNVAPTSYVDGMGVIFQIADTINDDVKVKINELGAKSIKNADNTPIKGGDFEANSYIHLRYNEAQGCFYIESMGGGGVGLPVGSIIQNLANSVENCVYTNGAEFTEGQFPFFYQNWLESGVIPTITYEEYQTELTMTGECWSVALDNIKKTFKIPFIKDEVLRDINITTNLSSTIPVRGNGKALGFTDNGRNLFNMSSNRAGNTGLYLWASRDRSASANAGWGKDQANTTFRTNFWGVTSNKNESGLVAELSSGAISNNTVKKVKTIKHFFVIATGSIKQSEMDWSRYMDGLNGKLNTDVQTNITKGGKEYISGLSAPSDRFDTLSLGPTGTPYTAPADGYYQFTRRQLEANQFIGIEGINDKLRTNVFSSSSSQTISVYRRVDKGETVKMIYGGNGDRVALYFIYSKGSK